MEAVIAKLNENLQVLFRKALDADKALEQLKGQGKGKYRAIFPKEAGFTTSSDMFTPYIAELSNDISSLNELLGKQKQEELNLMLSAVVKKMESVFVTLAQFNGVMAEN